MATQWLDFRALKAQVPIRDVLERYGFLDALAEKKPGKLVGPCPIHGGTGKTSFNVDTDKNVFNCFSGCGGGNVLDLVMKIEDVTIREAGEKLAGWFGLTFERKKRNGDAGNSAKVSEKSAGESPAARTLSAGDGINPPLERSLKNLNAEHDYIRTRGFTIETARHFGIGYCTRGIMRGRVAIPIHNTDGELVAYAGRAVETKLAEEKGKYRLPSNFTKSAVVWNLHRAREHVERGLVVVEGFFGAMKVHQAGFQNVIALMGSSVSDQQEQLLLAHTDRLALMFDGDDAGNACVREFYGRLRRRLFLKEIHLNNGEQPDNLEDARIRSLLS